MNKNRLSLLLTISIILILTSSNYFILNQKNINNDVKSIETPSMPKTDVYNHTLNNQPVNPYLFYNKEPAPMGIADYGINQNNNAYSYSTTSFLGSATVYKLLTYNSTQPKEYQYESTIQMNVNLAFSNDNINYYYWIQNVAIIGTNNNSIFFIDNIWNSSSRDASIYSSTLLGSGKIENSSIGIYFYYSLANQNSPGNGIFLKYPYNIKFKVNTYVNSNGNPVVGFFYNDGYGWINYDNVVFIFATKLTSHPVFIVNGNTLKPFGGYFDAELVLGGPGNGASTVDINSSLFLTMEYFNGHNYQEFNNSFNFGSDTAESISNVNATGEYWIQNGTLMAIITNGSGNLQTLYTSNYISNLILGQSLQSGTLYVNNTPYQFVNGSLNITIAPNKGSNYYTIYLYDSSGNLVWQNNITLYPGDVQKFSLYNVTVFENGLPTTTRWWVNLSNSQTFSSTTNKIFFLELNGSYSYVINSSSNVYTTNLKSGTFTVKGGATNITITFSVGGKYIYPITFNAIGLGINIQWWVNLSNGEVYTSTTGSVMLYEPNGTYNYTIEAVSKKYTPLNGTGFFNVKGAQITINVTFKFVYTYTILIVERGLPLDIQWWVNLSNGESFHTSNNTIYFIEPNGTYSYNISSYKEYIAKPSRGNITVSGSNINMTIYFTSVATKNQNIISSNSAVLLFFGVIFIIVLATITTLVSRKKEPKIQTVQSNPTQYTQPVDNMYSSQQNMQSNQQSTLPQNPSYYYDVTCPYCHTHLTVHVAYKGKAVQCPVCKQIIVP
ncbi:MAG: thermopsin [Thermoplasmata archaeon]